jgi:hypothetical protein
LIQVICSERRSGLLYGEIEAQHEIWRESLTGISLETRDFEHALIAPALNQIVARGKINLATH